MFVVMIELEKRKGRNVCVSERFITSPTKWRRDGVKRGETNLASKQFPKEEKWMTDEMVGWHH